MNQPSGDEYVYKYSGGLGTYCAKHQPFAIYCPDVEKTFFCYGGATVADNRRLVHMVSYFDHRTKQVPRPTILLDKQTDDAHDNPVISVDAGGHLWIFSTSHGRSRPSYIHRSKRPFDVTEFELIHSTRQVGSGSVPFDNFSYMQSWHVAPHGFGCFFTRYSDPVDRTIGFMASPDGINWGPWTRLAAFGEGHYQISAASQQLLASAFNYHPPKQGLNWRTNLYFVCTRDFGKTWTNISGDPLNLPLTSVINPALVHDYQAEQRNVYLKDLCFDGDGHPVVLYLTSGGYEAGPKNAPREWTTAHWTGERWQIRTAFTSDNNYDMGSLWIDHDGTWQIIAPTDVGPQPFNPGGEVVMWQSRDQGATWNRWKTLTHNSPHNHTYVRRPLNAHPDFWAFWADGHGRQPSSSALYYCNRQGQVFRLPRQMQAEFEEPEVVQ